MSGDPHYYNTSLLLPLTGTDGSTVFADYSYSQKTVTAVGNTRISTAQSKWGKGSAYFDGTGDYLSVPDSADFDLAGNDFTMEVWVYLDGYATINNGVYASTLFAKDVSGSQSFSLTLIGTDSSFTSLQFVGFDSGGYTVASGSYTFALGTWTHIEVTRSGNLIFLFVNSTLLNPGGTEFSRTIQTTSVPLTIGSIAYGGGYDYYLKGYLQDARITRVARHTANFSVPSGPPDAYFILPERDLYHSNKILLLPLSGTAGSTVFKDYSPLQNTITVGGNTQVSSSQTLFSKNTTFFDGSDDYLQIPYRSEFELQSDFRIDFWANVSVNSRVLSNRNASKGWLCVINPTTGIYFVFWDSGNAYNEISGPSIPAANQWNYVSIVRIGNSLTVYLNGVPGTPLITTSVPGLTSQTLGIGYDISSPTSNRTQGYLSGLSITTGTFSTEFSVPQTGPDLTGFSGIIQGDSFYNSVIGLYHLEGPDGGIGTRDYSLIPHPLTRTGNPISTSTKDFFGHSMGYFDGSSSLQTATDLAFFSVTDFAIECAFVLGTDPGSGQPHMISINDSPSVTTEIRLSIGGSGGSRVLRGVIYHSSIYHVNMTGSTVLSPGILYQVAFVRQNNLHTLYLNGIIEAQTTAVHTLPANNGIFQIGYLRSAPSDYYWNGYLGQIRYTGAARYNNSYTPSVFPWGAFYTPLSTDTGTRLNLPLYGSDGQTTILDYSGSRRSITNTGVVIKKTVTAKVSEGGSAYFDGSAYLTVPGIDFFDGSDDFEWSLWVYWLGMQGKTYQGVLAKDNVGVSRGWNIALSGTGTPTISFFETDNTPRAVSALQVLQTNVWTHLAVTLKNNVLRFFVGGVLQGSLDLSPYTLSTCTAPLVIGTLWQNSGPYSDYKFCGYMSNISIADQADKITDFDPNDYRPVRGQAIFNDGAAASKIWIRDQFGTLLDQIVPANGIYQSWAAGNLLLEAHRFNPQSWKGLWQPQKSYSVGDVVMGNGELGTNSDSILLQCLTAGTSGSVEPTETNLSDGTVIWSYLGTIRTQIPHLNYYQTH